MAVVEITKTNQGFSLSGDIRFDNVLSLRKKGHCLIQESEKKTLSVNLSQVVSSDTSGLSLLLRWLQTANQQGKHLTYHAVPDCLSNVANVCGVAEIIHG